VDLMKKQTSELGERLRAERMNIEFRMEKKTKLVVQGLASDF